MMLVSDAVRVRSIVLILCKTTLASAGVLMATRAKDRDDFDSVNALQKVSCADPTLAHYDTRCIDKERRLCLARPM